MRRLNLGTSLSVAGDATTGTITYSGLTSPTVTEIGDNPDVSVASDGVCTFAALNSSSEVVTVKVQDAAGYFIQGPVTITGSGVDTALYMPMGMNLASPSTYSGAYHFANMCHTMGPWARRATGGGSGTFTQSFGVLTASVSTNEFRAYLSDAGVAWPSGTYTIRNPDACEIAFGYGEDSPGSYTTSTSFTQDLSPTGGNGVYVFVKGSLTRLEIIQPGHVTSYDAGNIWSSDFLSYHQGLACSPIRFMDFTSASDNIETEWSQRVPATALSFVSGCAYGKKVVPWEHIFDLCNRLNADAWINIPVRASASYVSNLAALAASDLDAGLRVYAERGNETWNPGSAWAECRAWQIYYGNTKLTATANYGANTFTLVAHGLTTGDDVRCFSTPENEATALNQNYPYTSVVSGLARSNIAYVERVDADTFKLYSDVGRTTLLTVGARQVNQIVMQNTFSSANTVYGDMCIDMWDAFDAALGADRVVHLIPSQAGATGTTTARFSNTTAAARADCVAVAPYFNGVYFSGAVVTSSGTFAPQVWVSNDEGAVFIFAVYASGATPTIDDVIAGTGAIAHQVGTDIDNQDFWQKGLAGLSNVTGLSNGTSYKVFFVLNSLYMISDTITATASATTTYIFDTAAEQAKRMVLNAYYTAPTSGSYDHITASGGKPVICYEGGPDFNATRPVGDTVIDAWRTSIEETAEYAAACLQAQYIRASQSIDELTYFADVGSGSFSLADSYSDTTDPRYVAISGLGGRVQRYDVPSVADVSATTISADPGSFPYTAHTFADPSLTYTLLWGNNAANFDISGGTLRMIADNGVDWASSTTYSLTIQASNGYTIDLFVVTLKVGAAVFETETDALIARLSPAPDATHKLQINTLIAALKSASVWSKLDGFYLNCMASAGQITENWVSSSYDQTNNSGTFTANSGVAGNGSTAYESSTFNPSTATTPNFQRDSAHLWAYSLSTGTSDGSGTYEVGSTGPSGWALSTGRSDQGDAPRGGINASFVNYPVQANCKGMYVLSRTGASAIGMYKDGSSIGTDTSTTTGAPGNFTMAALRYNTFYSSKPLAGWGFGGGLTGADVSAMSSAIATYLTARGAI